ncbi:MAG: DUF87 domain-containing protein, partial [Candidatus Dadabacteria bacterium]|nr:DUF87 domain-containing protein [Candidatus Dadabacteria bacterium]
CLASSGSGKSYMAKLLISRYLLNGIKVMVIDPQGEYRALVKRFDGQLIDLSATSKTIINPLDLMGHDYPEKRLALMDLNPNSLKFTAEKVSRYKPEIYRGNILEPIETDMEKFDSIAINAVIHCLPGTMSTKLVVFDHINALLNPGGVVFGSTILNIGVKQNWLTKKFMKNFNNRRIFCNLEDDLSTLEEGLTERFSKSEVKVIGTVALFRAEV